MITTLQSLQDKFINDKAFADQFAEDTSSLGIGIPHLAEAVELEERRIAVENYGANLLTMYYRALQSLLTAHNPRYPVYVRVPFNEVTFKINSETRIITIPKDFNTNGVGVVGDHMAEFLWFEVDRFFDLTDLMTTDIKINWCNLANKENIYSLTPFAKYCDNEKMYFGWYISELASAAAGTIEFEVHMYKQDNGGTYTFSLHTQPAKITIKPAIKFESDIYQDDIDSTVVYSRPIYSGIVDYVNAAEPIFTENLTRGEYDLVDGARTFIVAAYSPDNIGSGNAGTAEIQFHWYWNDIPFTTGGANIDETPLHLQEEKEVIITAGTSLSQDYGTVYTSTLQTNVPGRYRCYVGNKIVAQENVNYGGVRTVQTPTVTIAPATQIAITPNMNNAVVYIGDTTDQGANAGTLRFNVDFESANGTVDYQWVRKDIGAADSTYAPITGFNPPVVIGQGQNPIVYTPTETASRGVYKAIVRNVKNLMSTDAETNPVIVIQSPKAITRENLRLTVDSENKLLVHVNINEGADYSVYRYHAELQPFNGGSIIQLFNSPSTVEHTGPSWDLNLGELALNTLQNAPGDYTLKVFVKEVTRPIAGDTTYNRDFSTETINIINVDLTSN